MEDLLKQFSSVTWWIGVFLVGILINIISVPLWRWTESKLSKYSNSRIDRNKAKAARRAQLLITLQANPTKQIIFAMQEHRVRIRSFQAIVESIMLLLVLTLAITYAPAALSHIALRIFSVAVGLISLGLAVMSLDDLRQSIEIKAIIKELNNDIPIY